MSQHAVLVILASVEPQNEVEFNLWYDREHLPNRIAVPGFLAARRYGADGAGRWRYLALYETEHIGVFTSPAYRERLANQSDWSKRVLPMFVQPQRNVTTVRLRVGVGSGAFLFFGIVRYSGDWDAVSGAVMKRVEAAVAADPDIVSVTVLQSDPTLSKPVAEYPPVANSPIGSNDWFVLVERVSASDPETTLAAVAATEADWAIETVGQFRLRSGIAPADLPPTGEPSG